MTLRKYAEPNLTSVYSHEDNAAAVIADISEFHARSDFLSCSVSTTKRRWSDISSDSDDDFKPSIVQESGNCLKKSAGGFDCNGVSTSRTVANSAHT